MKHFYFKFQRENKGLEKWFSDKQPKESIGQNGELAIYYGSWKPDDYKNGKWKNIYETERNDESKNELKKIDHVSEVQIETFFTLHNNNPEEVFFWIFYEHQVLCFQGVNLNVTIGNEKYKIQDRVDSTPKSIKVKLKKVYEKMDLPEFFSNLNSNQGYNRRTITPLKGSAHDFADHLINAGKTKNSYRISITKENFIDYLSPVEFETLIYEIIMSSHKDNFCSSFRGGTLKDFDLKVNIKNTLLGLPFGSNWIQLKKKPLKDSELKDLLKGKKLLIIHTGENSEIENTYNKKWIIDQIDRCDNKKIQQWLKEMIFSYSSFDFKWE